MNFLQTITGWLQQGQQTKLLGWFGTLSRAWSSQSSASPAPAPNSSTPAAKIPAPAPANSSETGDALKALLDLIAKAKA